MESIIGKTTTKAKPAFPVLRKSTRSGMVVLFETASSGTVVNVGNQEDYDIGHHSHDWVGAYTKSWEDFTESVTLVN